VRLTHNEPYLQIYVIYENNNDLAKNAFLGALFKKVVTTALFCRLNKRSSDEPSETEVNV
jgi:hypothetical protein